MHTAGVDEDVPVDFIAPEDVVDERDGLGTLALADGARLAEAVPVVGYRVGLPYLLQEAMRAQFVEPRALRVALQVQLVEELHVLP